MSEYDASALLGRSRIRQRIVALLLDGPAPRLHLRDIQRRVGTTPGTARRELMRLIETGLVKREAVGRNVYFSMRTDSPIYEPFRDLVRRTVGVPSVIRRHVETIKGVHQATVFGSYATGLLKPESDIDLLIIGAPDRDELTDRLQAAEREIGRAINETVFTEDEFERHRERGDRFVAGIDAGPTIPVLP